MTNQTQKTYTLVEKMTEDWNEPRFTFTAKNDDDANSKVYNWLRYHGMSRDEATTREATAEEISKNMLHNEWVR